MPVTFQVVGNLADFGDDPRAGVKVRATATPGVKVGDVAVHSNQPETVTTDEDGAFALTLISVPGVWYTIRTPYSNAINTVRLAGYTPDSEDPTTGTAFEPGVVIDLIDVMDEDPTPGYEAIVVGGGSGGSVDSEQTVTLTADATVTLTPAEGATTHTLFAIQDTPTGGWAVTVEPPADTFLSWAGGVAPVGSTAPATIDVYVFVKSGTLWLGSLSGSFPDPTYVAPDTTPPTAGTLTSSAIGETGFTLTIGSPNDDVGLHATPFQFSTNNGGAYSAWQSSATYAATGLAASTAYTCVHQTRDAAGNVSTGSSIVVTTSSSSVLIPALSGRWQHYDLSVAGSATSIPSQACDSTLTSAGAPALTTVTSGPLTMTTINGLNAVSVPAGASIRNSTTAAGQFSTTGNGSIVAVFRLLADPDPLTTWTAFASPSTGLKVGGYSDWRIDGIKGGSPTDTGLNLWDTGTTYVIIATLSGTTNKIYRNGHAGVTQTVTAGLSNAIFNELTGGPAGLGIVYGEAAIFDRALTSGEAASLMSGLCAKWGATP